MACTSCKKKKPITKLPEVTEEIDIPTVDEIKEGYSLMKYNGTSKEDLDKIKRIFRFVMNEELNLNCSGCAPTNFRRFEYKIKNDLNIEV